MQKTYIDYPIIAFFLKIIIYPLSKLKGIKLENIDVMDQSGLVVVSPHTSNWDFLFGFYCALKYNLKTAFLIKESWCKGPAGKIVKFLGGIPVNRKQSNNVVEFVAEILQNNQEKPIFIAITPEGTRRKVNSWKEGFYYISQKSQCPIYMTTIDYKNKTFKVWNKEFSTSDKEKDMKRLMDIASNAQGKNKENQFPPFKNY